MDIFVPDYDWNSHWSTVEESAGECDYAEGEEFKMVRLTVGACTTYKIVGGKPVPMSVAFPDAAPSNVQAQARTEDAEGGCSQLRGADRRPAGVPCSAFT